MTGSITGARSLLFAPGHDETKLRKALQSEADAVVADLEDAVPPADKDAARHTIADVFAEEPPRPARFVRINSPETSWANDDLAALTTVDHEGLMLPKATPSAIDALGTDSPVIALIETATGIRYAFDTAFRPQTVALMLGGADLAADANLEVRQDGQEFLFARSTLVFASTAAGIRSPFDIVHLDVHNPEGQEREATLARSVGFGGKACIHPAQLKGVHAVFTPSAEEVEHARQIITAYNEATGRGETVVLLHGKVIDPPVVAHAQATLARVPVE